eukprot:ANDGO_00519.mRNA.1 hypothetical protein
MINRLLSASVSSAVGYPRRGAPSELSCFLFSVEPECPFDPIYPHYLRKPVYDVKFSPDGRLLACSSASSGGLVLVDSCEPSVRVASLQSPLCDSVNMSTWISEYLIASASEQGVLGLWDVRMRRLMACMFHGSAVKDVFLLPSASPGSLSSRIICSAGFDDCVRIWPLHVSASVHDVEARIKTHMSTGRESCWMLQSNFVDSNVWIRAGGLCRTVYVPGVRVNLGGGDDDDDNYNYGGRDGGDTDDSASSSMPLEASSRNPRRRARSLSKRQSPRHGSSTKDEKSRRRRSSKETPARAEKGGSILASLADSSLAFFDVPTLPCWTKLKEPRKVSFQMMGDDCVSMVTAITPFTAPSNAYRDLTQKPHLSFIARSVMLPLENTAARRSPASGVQSTLMKMAITQDPLSELPDVSSLSLSCARSGQASATRSLCAATNLSVQWYATEQDLNPQYSKQPAVCAHGRFLYSPAGKAIRVFDLENPNSDPCFPRIQDEELALCEDAVMVTENKVLACVHDAPVLCCDVHPYWPIVASGAADGSIRTYQPRF